MQQKRANGRGVSCKAAFAPGGWHQWRQAAGRAAQCKPSHYGALPSMVCVSWPERQRESRRLQAGTGQWMSGGLAVLARSACCCCGLQDNDAAQLLTGAAAAFAGSHLPQRTAPPTAAAAPIQRSLRCLSYSCFTQPKRNVCYTRVQKAPGKPCARVAALHKAGCLGRSQAAAGWAVMGCCCSHLQRIVACRRLAAPRLLLPDVCQGVGVEGLQRGEENPGVSLGVSCRLQAESQN